MIKIVLVEDDQFKCQRITAFVEELMDNFNLVVAKSVTSGMRETRKGDAQLILMDMSLPTYDVGAGEYGGEPQGFGGIEVLRDMERMDVLAPTVVITQLEEFGKGQDKKDISMLKKQLLAEYPEHYIGLVFYRQSGDEWKQELKDLIDSVLGNGKDSICP